MLVELAGFLSSQDRARVSPIDSSQVHYSTFMFVSLSQWTLYRVIQEESAILWEMIVRVILSKTFI